MSAKWSYYVGEMLLTGAQAYCDTSLVSAQVGQLEVYLRDCACVHRLSRGIGGLPLRSRRHAIRAWQCRRRQGEGRDSGSFIVPGHCICIHMSSEREFMPAILLIIVADTL